MLGSAREARALPKKFFAVWIASNASVVMMPKDNYGQCV